MRKPLLAGNWKMNLSREEAFMLVSALRDAGHDLTKVDMAVLVPFVHMGLVAELLTGHAIGYGAQNLYPQASGAFTGEVSPAMLKDYGAQYVIVGHSERRALFNESDDFVAEKWWAAIEAGLTPIFCVGETQQQYDAGETEQVIARQLASVLKHADVATALAHTVVAYEPVWAIGTGLTATPEQAQAVHAFIRAQISTIDTVLAQSVRILYGGSAKPSNIAGLLAKPDIDGGLVGGASLQADAFNEMVDICINSSLSSTS